MFDTANALRTYLKEKGIRQSYLVRECGVTSDRISRMLNGHRRIRAEELINFCRALHLTVEELSEFDRLK